MSSRIPSPWQKSMYTVTADIQNCHSHDGRHRMVFYIRNEGDGLKFNWNCDFQFNFNFISTCLIFLFSRWIRPFFCTTWLVKHFEFKLRSCHLTILETKNDNGILNDGKKERMNKVVSSQCTASVNRNERNAWILKWWCVIFFCLSYHWQWR